MVTPISPIEIERKILYISEQMEEEIEEFKDASTARAEAEADYKRLYAEEYLQKNGPVKERESWASYVTAAQHKDFLIKEALEKSKRMKMDSLRSQCDAFRTLAANARGQYGA